MDTLTLIATLVLSCIIRGVTDGNLVSLTVDNAALIVLCLSTPSFPVSLLLSLGVFLGLAYIETRAQYMDPTNNTRENPDQAHPPIGPSSDPGMCPVLGPGSQNHKKLTSVLSLPSSDDGNRLDSRQYQSEPEEYYGKPILFPCNLRHRRVAPFKDTFRHSYVYCGVPVGLRACYSPILSVDQPRDSHKSWLFRKAWFNMRPEDHAIRGALYMSISQKLKEFLLSEGADLNEWKYAYLLAVPCVSEQVNSPLDFWYLYNEHKELTAIIAELNTSYGERRMWLIRQALPAKSGPGGRYKGPYCFRGHFGKDIHVSPFMPPTGGYTIDTSDPCATPHQFDALVTLTSPEGKPLMLTRVGSSATGLDVSAASLREKLSFLIRWCYVPMCSVMTFRILSESARIYLKHKPRVWNRQEPLRTALGKPARADERTLERVFRRILKESVEKYRGPISVYYITPGEHSKRAETFYSHAYSQTPARDLPPPTDAMSPPSFLLPEAEPLRKIEFQVISPIFYSRFFHYKSVHDGIVSELLDVPKSRTAWSSEPQLFASIFDTTSCLGGPNPTPRKPGAIKYPAKSARWQWSLLSALRRAPEQTNFPRKTEYRPFTGLSEMDEFVLLNCDIGEVNKYRRALLRLYAGEWIGGFNLAPFMKLSGDLELIGLSRDAVLSIYGAVFKAAILTRAVQGLKTTGEGSYVPGIVGCLVAGINLWQSLIASL